MTVVVRSVQGSASNSTAATTQAITPSGIVAGRALFLWIANLGGSATGALSGVADTGGNTWSISAIINSGVSGATGTRLAFAYTFTGNLPGTITATMGSIGSRKLLLLEVSGLLNNVNDDQQVDNTTGAVASNDATAPAATMGGAEFVMCAESRPDTADPTGVNNSYILSTTFPGGAGLPDLTSPILRVAWQEFPVAGTSPTCAFTHAATSKWTAATATFGATPSNNIPAPHVQAVPFMGGAGGGGKMN